MHVGPRHRAHRHLPQHDAGIGPILAAAPGVLAALIHGSDRLDMSNPALALIVTSIYVVVTHLQSNLIAPRVMGSAVNLRPAVIMLMVGLQVGGLLGSLLAVPVIATGREIVRYFCLKPIDCDPEEAAVRKFERYG